MGFLIGISSWADKVKSGPSCVDSINRQLQNMPEGPSRSELQGLLSEMQFPANASQDSIVEEIDRRVGNQMSEITETLHRARYKFYYGLNEPITGKNPRLRQDPRCTPKRAAYLDLGINPPYEQKAVLCLDTSGGVTSMMNSLKHEYLHVLQTNQHLVSQQDIKKAVTFDIKNGRYVSQAALRYTPANRLTQAFSIVIDKKQNLEKKLEKKELAEVTTLVEQFGDLNRVFYLDFKFGEESGVDLNLRPKIFPPKDNKDFENAIMAEFARKIPKAVGLDDISLHATRLGGQSFGKWLVDPKKNMMNSCWKADTSETQNFLSCVKIYSDELVQKFNKFAQNSAKKSTYSDILKLNFQETACLDAFNSYCLEMQSNIQSFWLEYLDYAKYEKFGLGSACVDIVGSSKVLPFVIEQNWDEADKAIEKQVQEHVNRAYGTQFSRFFAFDSNVFSADKCKNPPSESYFLNGCHGTPDSPGTKGNGTPSSVIH